MNFKVFFEPEPYCEDYNDFMLNIFMFLKFILGFVLILIGTLTVLKIRGIYLQIRIKQGEKETDQLNTVRIILGMIYLFMGFGIIFNFFIYFNYLNHVQHVH